MQAVRFDVRFPNGGLKWLKKSYGTDDLSGLHLLTCGIRGLYAPALGALLIAVWNPSLALWVAAALVLVGMVMLPPTETIARLTNPRPSSAHNER